MIDARMQLSKAPYLGRVSIITLSSRPDNVLRGAIKTVQDQDYGGETEMIIVGDNAQWSPDDWVRMSTSSVAVRCFNIVTSREFADLAPVKRVAQLRNIGLTLVTGDYFGFLDDDNRWEHDHLSSLVRTLHASGNLAAHCWRRLHDANGMPWIADRFPWTCEPGRAASLFQKFRDAGMLSTSDNVFRDKAYAAVGAEDVGAVDMGAWLFRRPLLDRVKFETQYTDWEVRNSVTEDDKLLSSLKEARIEIAATEAATLLYFLGGYSNRQAGNGGCE